MSVIDFPRPAREWRPDELQQLVSLADAARFSGVPARQSAASPSSM